MCVCSFKELCIYLLIVVIGITLEQKPEKNLELMFCCMLLYVHSSIAIILMGKRELIALLNLSSWCLVMVERLFLAVPRGCLQFVIVVFPDHTHLLFLGGIFFRTKICLRDGYPGKPE